VHAFLPRDAMHKRGLCRRACGVSPSVRLTNVYGDQQVVDSTRGRFTIRSQQDVLIGVPLSPSSIIWYWAMMLNMAGKVTAGLAECTAIGMTDWRRLDQLWPQRSFTLCEYFTFICTVSCSCPLYTSSSAVAKRARDALCLSVVSFNSAKRRVESFIVSYVGYRFITACS